ncbi:hypothetical protein B7P43_G14035, partial [Cryptotermes secundus]
LREACGDAALLYRTVARWVKLFREGRDAIRDSRRSGRPHVDSHTIQLFASLLDVNHRWAVWELAAEVGVYQKAVFHILYDILGYRKIAVRWVPHTMSEVQPRQRYAIAQDLLDCWRWEILQHPPYSPDMSSCDYALFAKMKEPLRGTRYNTREELIHAVGRSLQDINRSGPADGVRRLPQIWQKVVHMGRIY